MSVLEGGSAFKQFHCMYVRTYVYVCTVHTYIHTYVHTYIGIHTYVYREDGHVLWHVPQGLIIADPVDRVDTGPLAASRD